MAKKRRIEAQIFLTNFTPGEANVVTCEGCHAELNLSSDAEIGECFQCPGCRKTLEMVWYRAVSDPKELQDYLDKAREVEACSFDYETTGLNPFQKKIVGVSFCRIDEPCTAIYVPIRHSVGKCMDEDVAREIIAPFLSTHPMVAHNMNFEYKWTKVRWGVAVKIFSCTQIEAWLQDLNRTSRFDPRSLKLKAVANEVFAVHVTDFDEMIDPKTQDFSFLPVEIATPYGCQDSILATRLLHRFRPYNLKTHPDAHYREHELIPLTAEMELRGVLLDEEALHQGMPVLEKEMRQKQREVFLEMGYDLPEEGWKPPFNLNTASAVAKALFHDLGIPHDPMFVGKPTDLFQDGQPSTSKKALALLRDDYRVIDLHLSYKEDAYAISNYIKKLPEKVEPTTGAIHTGFMQTGTPTQRYTSNNPNLQAITKPRD